MKDESWIPIPPPGAGRLRRLLQNLDEPAEKLTNHHLYKEGFEDGYRQAQDNHKKLLTALSVVYRINESDI
jgi:hypothetical protein